jgi:ATP-dependent protease ClpP protease subunit
VSDEHGETITMPDALMRGLEDKGGDDYFGVMLPEARIVMLAEDIYEGTYNDIVRALTRLSMQSSDDINLHIATGGGDAFTGLGLADAIDELQKRGAARGAPLRVVGKAMGHCMSAGFIVLQACIERQMGARSWLMMHGASNSMFRADHRNMTAEVELTRKMNEQHAEWLAERTKQGRDFWLALLQDNTPHYWSAEEALADGLIDRIL